MQPDADADANEEMAMTVEEAMDMAPDDASDEEDTKMGDGDGERDSPVGGDDSVQHTPASLPPDTPMMAESWISPTPSDSTMTLDPRSRAMDKDDDWDGRTKIVRELNGKLLDV